MENFVFALRCPDGVFVVSKQNEWTPIESLYPVGSPLVALLSPRP